MLPRPPLSLSLAGLDRDPARPWNGGGARSAIEWAASAGFRSLQLDGTMPGVRARELDRSARRDLAALLRRVELTPSGIDLWIPPEHLLDPERVDRAVAATVGAMELSADLAALAGGGGRGVVSVLLPEGLPGEVLEGLVSKAEAIGARLADHRFPPGDRAGGAAGDERGPIGVGVDPAAVLMSGGDPAALVSRAGAALASARLSDASTFGRVTPGAREGRLDELSYVVALGTAGYERAVVLDLRGVPEQEGAVREVVAGWEA